MLAEQANEDRFGVASTTSKYLDTSGDIVGSNPIRESRSEAYKRFFNSKQNSKPK
jgi:hypothetical protein